MFLHILLKRRGKQLLKSKLCTEFNVKYPILQGGMAWIADASLASAVSNAGGLGVIAAGNAPADVVREEIKKAKELTDKPFGVNIMLMSRFADEIAELVCEEKISFVTTGAGNPGKYMKSFKESNIRVIPVIPSVALAKRMERDGADFIIAEGMEAGGHIGKLTTMALVPQVVSNVDIPVIAAGGIGDGRGMAAALVLGADAVQVGTRFLLAKECNIHQNYKDIVIKAKDIDTVITGQITGHPVRGLRNKFTKEFLEIEKTEAKKDKPDIEMIESLGAGSLRRAVVDGDINTGSFMSGQIAGLLCKEQSCAEMIEEFFNECIKEVEKLYKKFI